MQPLFPIGQPPFGFPPAQPYPMMPGRLSVRACARAVCASIRPFAHPKTYRLPRDVRCAANGYGPHANGSPDLTPQLGPAHPRQLFAAAAFVLPLTSGVFLPCALCLARRYISAVFI